VEDHENAAILAAFLAELPGAVLDHEAVQTNIIIAGLTADAPFDAPTFVQRLKEVAVLITYFGQRKVRLVTHLDVSRSDIEEACQRIRGIWKR
ncbi:MAG: hypothetical protein ABH878_09115, partial [bacterium]